MAETLETLENLKNTIDDYREVRGFLNTTIPPVNLPVYVLIGWGGFVVYINVATLALESTLQAGSIDFIKSKVGIEFDGKYPVTESSEEFLSEDDLLNIARAFDECPDYDAENEEDLIQLAQLDCLLTALDAEINEIPVFPDDETDPTQAAMRAVDKALKPRLIAAIKKIVGTNPDESSRFNENANDILEITTTTRKLRDDLPFSYDRTAAAAFAISVATANFTGFPQNHDDVDSLVGGKIRLGDGFDYSAIPLSHRPGFTGSGIFISECIFAGQLPMTVAHQGDPYTTGCTTEYGDLNGWRVCPGGNATGNWRNHQGIRAYFPAGGASDKLGEIILDDVNLVVYFNPDSPSTPDKAGKLRTEETTYDTAVQALIDKFSTSPLNTLKAGDYVYINVETGDEHGFLVAGWGPIKNTLEGIEYAQTHSLSQARIELSSDDTIPYLVDFCFGTKDTKTDVRDSENEDDRTGWKQDPRPRPFYSSRCIIKGDTYLLSEQIPYLRKIYYPTETSPLEVAFEEFRFSQWDFYKIPDVFSLPFARLYRGTQ